jgi:uncharacterized repeat protein (TIGR01451 family)
MFQGCASLQTLDLSSFNMSKVNYMVSMFADCTSLTTLDLTGTPPFRNDVLAENVFSNRNAGLLIYVNNDTVKQQILSFDDYISGPLNPAQIIVVPPSTLPLLNQPNAVLSAPKSPTTRAGQNTITDILPDGLTVISTDPPADGTNPLTWTFASGELPKTVVIRAKVGDYGLAQGQADLGSEKGYVNQAIVSVQGVGSLSDSSNKTFHRANAAVVREDYYVWKGLSGAYTPNLSDANMLDDELVTTLGSAANPYYVQKMRRTIGGYIYVGYMRLGIDRDLVRDNPPDPAYFDGTGGHSQGYAANPTETIILFYEPMAAAETVNVTIHFANADPSYGDLANPNFGGQTSVTTKVAKGEDYWLLQRYAADFTLASQQWTYVDYKNSYTQWSAPSDTGDHAAPHTPPHYPSGDYDHPLFTAAQMNGDQDITLYFRQTVPLTVRYAELNNESHALKNPETYFAETDLSGKSDEICYEGTDDGNCTGGKKYEYEGYSVDGGALQSGTPPTDALPGTVVTLFYSTKNTVTEMFHGIEPGEDEHEVNKVTVLKPDETTAVVGGGSFDPDMLYPSIPKDGETWLYIGYRQGWNDDEPLHEGYPPPSAFASLRADAAIIYVYAKDVHTKTAQVNGSVRKETGTKAAPIKVNVGDLIKYTFLLRPQALADGETLDVVITDVIPDGTEFVESNPPAPPALNVVGQTVTLTNAAFNPAQDDEFSITVRALAAGSFENSATVSVNGDAKPTNHTFHSADSQNGIRCDSVPDKITSAYLRVISETGGISQAMGEIMSLEAAIAGRTLACENAGDADSAQSLTDAMEQVTEMSASNGEILSKALEFLSILQAQCAAP